MKEQKEQLKDRATNLHAKFGLASRVITPPLGIYSRNWGRLNLIKRPVYTKT